MLPWLVLAATVVGLLLIHVAVLAVVSHRAGLEPTHVRIGTGPLLASTLRGELEFELRAFLLAGSVSNRKMETAPLASVLAPGVAASLSLVIVAVAILGPGEAVTFIGSAGRAMFAGALSPSGEAQRLIDTAIAAIEAGPHLQTAGRAAAAIGAANLVFTAWTPALRGSPKLQVFATLFPAVLALPWGFAWLIYLL